MLKLMILLARREGMAPEDFARHVREVHTPLVLQLPGLRRLVINHVLPDPSGPPPQWDAIAEDWFDGPEEMQAALASPAGEAVNADAPNFVDLTKLQFMVVLEEDVPLPVA